MRIPTGKLRDQILSGYDAAAAKRDGWSVSGPAGGKFITRTEDGPFSDDDEAERHVLQKAWDGSSLHEAAIAAVLRGGDHRGRCKAYVTASADFLKRRAESARMRCDRDHAERTKAAMSGPMAADIKGGWAIIAAAVLGRMSANPGETASAAEKRAEAALRMAKDEYLLEIDSGVPVSEAVSAAKRRGDLASFMNEASPKGAPTDLSPS